MLLTPIAAPPNRQASTGLIALASPHPTEGNEWEGGFTFDPEPCGGGQAIAIECGTSPAASLATHPGLVQYEPPALAVMDRCSTLDRGRDGRGIASRLLLSRQSALLEAVFWTGVAEGDDVTGQERPHLADGRATVLAGGTAVSVVQGLAVLDQAMTAGLGGVPGMVHVSPHALVRLKQANVLEYDGGRYYTPNRHLVVSGAGYTGGGPRPTVGGALPAAPDLLAAVPVDQWIYGTSPVWYLLGATEVTEAIDRAVNDDLWIAERPGAAFYGCGQWAVQLDTSTSP